MTLPSEQELIDKLDLPQAEWLGHCDECHENNGEGLQSIEVDGVYYDCCCNIKHAAEVAIRMKQQKN
jgi:hypothetical protein